MPVVLKRNLKMYITEDGKSPFVDWLESLDNQIRYLVKEKLDRIALGNLGDHKYIAQGVSEFRMSSGSGYRIYYGEEGNSVILLLCGGNKSTQKRDIKKAINYFKNYLSR